MPTIYPASESTHVHTYPLTFHITDRTLFSCPAVTINPIYALQDISNLGFR